MVKNPLPMQEIVLIPVLGRSPGQGNSNPLCYSCLGNPMDRGPWQATLHGVTKEFEVTYQQQHGCFHAKTIGCNSCKRYYLDHKPKIFTVWPLLFCFTLIN